jgi:EpsI family protein
VTRRRELILGAACVLSAGTALALKPRHKVSLLSPGRKLADILPRQFGRWGSRDVSDLYAPETPDSLLARLYGETVARLFVNQETGAQVMMLMAHGDSQSNELQLHRPEVCYPAFGFALVESHALQLKIGTAMTLPGRRLIAQSNQEKQSVIYWTRLGEYFPITVTEQRLDRLNTAIHRYIPDGLLARFSMAGQDTSSAFVSMQTFISSLVMHVSKDQRSVLVGTERARLLPANPSRT